MNWYKLNPKDILKEGDVLWNYPLFGPTEPFIEQTFNGSYQFGFVVDNYAGEPVSSLANQPHCSVWRKGEPPKQEPVVKGWVRVKDEEPLQLGDVIWKLDSEPDPGSVDGSSLSGVVVFGFAGKSLYAINYNLPNKPYKSAWRKAHGAVDASVKIPFPIRPDCPILEGWAPIDIKVPIKKGDKLLRINKDASSGKTITSPHYVFSENYIGSTLFGLWGEDGVKSFAIYRMIEGAEPVAMAEPPNKNVSRKCKFPMNKHHASRLPLP